MVLDKMTVPLSVATSDSSLEKAFVGVNDIIDNRILYTVNNESREVTFYWHEPYTANNDEDWEEP